MKDLLHLLRRFLPPYKGKVIQNFIYNLLAAIFGAFSFGLLAPILGILFKTREEVRTLLPFEFSVKAIENNLSYFSTWLIDKNGQTTALIYICLLYTSDAADDLTR